MMNGEKIPPTAYASRGHTNIHLAFINSEPIKNLPRGKFDTFIETISAHILGESTAQDLRSQGGTQTPLAQPGQSVAQGVEGSEAQASMPGKMVGATGIAPTM